MDSSSEDLDDDSGDESMQDVIERANAYLRAEYASSEHSFRSSTPGELSIPYGSGSSSLRSSTPGELSIPYGSGASSLRSPSPGEISIPYGSGSSSLRLSSAGEPSTSYGSGSSSLRLSTAGDLSVSFGSGSSTAGEPSIAYSSSGSNASGLNRMDSDCVVLEAFANQSDDEGSRGGRRRADGVPVVESVNLDDSLTEQKPAGNSSAARPPSPQTVPVSCPICFESVFERQAASTTCGHMFCHSCITQEIKIRHKCPMCQRPLKPSQVIPIYVNF